MISGHHNANQYLIILNIVFFPFRQKRIYHKSSKTWGVVNVKVDKKYVYIKELQEQIITACLQYKQPMNRSRPLKDDDPRRIKSTAAVSSPPPTGELAAKKASRFKNV